MTYTIIPSKAVVDNSTIELNEAGELQIKGGSVTPQIMDDKAKSYLVGTAQGSSVLNVPPNVVNEYIVIYGSCNPGKLYANSYSTRRKSFSIYVSGVLLISEYYTGMDPNANEYIEFWGGRGVVEIYKPTDTEKINGFSVEVNGCNNWFIIAY